MSGATKAKAPVERGLSQTNKSERTPTVPNVRADDGAVNPRTIGAAKQTVLVTLAVLRQIRGDRAALIRNTDGGRVLGYARLVGYGDTFDAWASPDGSCVAWCERPLEGWWPSRRLRLCLADLIAHLRAEAGQ